jgi:hypothetical protein
MNNEIALATGVLEALVVLLKTQDTSRTAGVGNFIPQPNLRPYIKFALRCLTSAIRTEPAVSRFYMIEGSVQKILEILEVVEDQEIIANSCKIIRICLRDDSIYDRMVAQYPILATLVIEKMAKWNSSQPIIQESSSALRNYVRKPEYAKLLRPDSVDVLIDLARDPKFEKVRPVIGQALKMMSKVPEMDQRIRLRNGTDLLQ